ncbi:MAG: DUF4412 domain-containing protein [Cyclobacteriaceae bacterium]
MKNSIVFMLLMFTLKVSAQNFEGTISWAVQTEIKDPQMKAQMEQAQKQMNDPAMQARMKEMQERMNDPQMKAMMESNPQMKAQMDKMMQMMNGGGVESMMPKSMLIKIKNQNTLTRMEGGMMAGDILYLKEKEQSYHLDRDNKTYSVLGGNTSDKTMEAKVTKTSESASILGYKCTKYIVEMTEGGKSITQYLWATTELKGIDMSGLSRQKMKGGNSLFYSEIEGVPLKIQMTMPEMEMVMEAKEIKKESLPADQFIIPSNFKEVKGMMSGN